MRYVVLAGLIGLAGPLVLAPVRATAVPVPAETAPEAAATAVEPLAPAAPDAVPSVPSVVAPQKAGPTQLGPTQAGDTRNVAKPKPVAPTLVARVDLARQVMKVSVNGKTLYSWKVSSGVRGHETPVGSFKPSWKSAMWYSRTYDNAPMPHSVFFKDGAAIHGSTSTAWLGRPASHGCVRLAPAAARTFYQLVSRHGFPRTRIVVTGKAPAVGFPGVARSTGRYVDRYALPQPHGRAQRHAQRHIVGGQSAGPWYYPPDNRRYVYPGEGAPSRYRPYWAR